MEKYRTVFGRKFKTPFTITSTSKKGEEGKTHQERQYLETGIQEAGGGSPALGKEPAFPDRISATPPPHPAPNRLCPDQTPGRQGGVERAEVHAGAAGRGGPAPAPEEIRDPAMLSQKEEIKDPVSRSKETAQER